MTEILSAADAERGVYVDFECLKSRPQEPMLLGVLFGADDFEQLVTDPRLHPAALAMRGRVRVVPLTEAVGELVSRAAREKRALIGWSFFDHDRMVEGRPDLAAEISARYVNALQVARPWRRTIYPDFTVDREDQFAARHTLDKYARLARYPAADALAGGVPAKWIRSMLAQLAATGGRYRRTTAATKRDWHRLLDYNRHDCLALRRITVRATRELTEWRTYERSRLCVDDGRREICFMIGSTSARLDTLLARRGERRWAFVASARAAPIAAAAGHVVLSGRRIGPEPAMPPEPCSMILGIGRREAVQLGRTLGQLAIVVGQRTAKSSLVPCAQSPRLK